VGVCRIRRTGILLFSGVTILFLQIAISETYEAIK